MRPRTAWMLGSRAGFAALAVAAGLVAWRAGRTDANAPLPPRPEARAEGAASTPGAHKAAGETYEVALRLVDVARDARMEMAKDAAAPRILDAHARKTKPALAPAGAAASRWLTSIALQTSEVDARPAKAKAPAAPWSPDASVASEGSFDQREALISPGASTIAFDVTVPAEAKLSFAEGTVNATKEATVFSVTVVDQNGAIHSIHRHELPPSSARRWTPQSVDLSAFAGQKIELRLSTGTAPAPPPAPAPQTPVAAKKPKPKPDVLATPGVPVALWGNPVVLAKTRPRLPYNVLWIVVDALRPDVIASFHDDAEDAAKRGAKSPPLDALLPKVPGLTPEIDRLAERGVRFTSAYSAATWTRPGTLAMLAGARSGELGIDTTEWALPPGQAAKLHASDPPLLPLILRREGAVTRAFVNNPFMAGHAPGGLDMGFERLVEHRYRTRDTDAITEDATAWIAKNKDARFFAFVNYASPNEPYDPPKKLVQRVPLAPAGPKDPMARLYMAEAAKDDVAIGRVMAALDEAGLRDRTIVVLTADHGETLSPAHNGASPLGKVPVRFHHAEGNFEETARVPILVVAPGLLPAGAEVKARVRTVDLAPTIAELLGVEPHPRMSGRSLVPLAKGAKEPDERVVVTEGRGSRAVIHGRHRLVVHEGDARAGGEHLFDLVDDPGERRDLAASQPDLVAEMKARLDAALKNVPVAGSAAAVAAGSPAEPHRLALRFVGAGQARRVSGALVVGDANTKAKSFDVVPVEIGKDALRIEGTRVELALTTTPAAPVGVDVIVDPPGVPVTWELYLDDQPWPDEAVFGGPYGLLAPALRAGIATDEARAAARAPGLPTIDPRRESGLFVVRAKK